MTIQKLDKKEEFNELKVKISNQHGSTRFRATEYEEFENKIVLYKQGDYVAGIGEKEIWTARNGAQVSFKADVDLEKIKNQLRTIQESPFHDYTE